MMQRRITRNKGRKFSQNYIVSQNSGATVIVLHHQAKTKNSQYRGSSDILAAVDAAFELIKKKEKDQTILTLRCFKHRFMEEFDINIHVDLQNGSLQVVADNPSGVPPAVID